MTLFRVPQRLLQVALVLLLIAVLYGLFRLAPHLNPASSQSGAPPAPPVVPAAGSPDWQTANWSLSYSQATGSAPQPTGLPTITLLPPPDVPMPPGDYCSYIAQITGKPCVWRVQRTQFEDGSEFYDVELSSGDLILARGNAMKVSLSEMVEVTKTYPSPYGWLDYIEVAKWLERAGFGRLILQAIDYVLQREAGGQPVVKIFVDAAGWAAKVLPPGADRFGEKVYIYLINYGR